MARRAGKAASRKARQRRIQRPGSAPPQAPVASGDEQAAFEAAARVTAPAARRAIPARQTVGSQLTATERSEYHYVERDLRDIGILSVVMAALLALSWFIVQGLGIIG